MIDKMLYKVNIKKTDEGYSVWVPGLPGCWSQGKTEDDALENIKDAIESYLETVEKQRICIAYLIGNTPPDPSQEGSLG